MPSLLAFPIEWRQLEGEQRRNTEMHKKACDNIGNCSIEQVLDGRHDIAMKNNRCHIPSECHAQLIKWHHEMLRHPGSTCLHKTLNKAHCTKGLRDQVNRFTERCSACQSCKKSKRKCGKLPVKHSLTVPWYAARVDLVGPCAAEMVKGDATLDCLTIADPVTCWVELVENFQ